jgi:hypothetical protein
VFVCSTESLCLHPLPLKVVLSFLDLAAIDEATAAVVVSTYRDCALDIKQTDKISLGG